MTEARKLLKADELEEFKWTLEEYIKNGSDENLSKEWMKELENASAKVHISRLEAIRLQIQQELEKVTGKEVNALESLLKETYEDEYYHRIFDVQQGIGFGSTFAKLSERQIEAAVNHPWASDGSSFSDRIWKNKKTLLNTLDQEVTRTILTGKPWSEATEAIAEKLNVEKSKAGRLVMTESAAIATEAEKACYKELDVDEYKIIATLDKRTSQICREMDGKHFPVSEMKAGVTAPPFHPWCRTDTAPYFDDWEEMGISPERAARDQADRVYYVPESMTYREWEKKCANDFDFMGQPSKYEIKDKSIKAYAVDKHPGIYTQTNTADAQKTIELIEKSKENIPEIKIVSEIVVSKDIPGVAAYDHENNRLYVNEKLSNADYIKENVANGYYAAETAEETLKHEMYHKKHWDNIHEKALKSDKDDDTIKVEIEADLKKYVKECSYGEPKYLLNTVSRNASVGLYNHGSVNELVADVMLLNDKGKVNDEYLLELVKGCIE